MKEAIEDPDVVGWTPERVMQLGQDWIDAVLRTTPAEELFKLPEAVKKLERVHQEGILENELDMFHWLLQHRFGPAPEWVNAKLAEVDLVTLKTWTRRILDADSLQTVFL